MGLREQKKQETRNQLIQAAERLFNQLDFEQVTVEQLATEAGISRKTFFNYFASKGLLLETLALSWMETSSAWEEDANSAESALIPPAINSISQWVITHRKLLKMVEKHTRLFEANFEANESSAYRPELYANSRAPRLARVRKAQAAGSIRADIDAEMICQMYDSLRLDAVRYWLRKPDEEAQAEDFHRYYEAVKSVLLQGISPS